jgi:hypothetical protein
MMEDDDSDSSSEDDDEIEEDEYPDDYMELSIDELLKLQKQVLRHKYSMDYNLRGPNEELEKKEQEIRAFQMKYGTPLPPLQTQIEKSTIVSKIVDAVNANYLDFLEL